MTSSTWSAAGVGGDASGTRLDSGVCRWLSAEDGSRLGKVKWRPPVGCRSGVVEAAASLGWPVVVVDALVIMQLEFHQSFVFLLVEVPQISSTSVFRTFQVCVRTSQVQVLLVDVLVHCSDKLKQFTFVVGVLVQKTAEFSQAQFGRYSLGATLGSTVDTCVATVPGCLWTWSHIVHVKAEPRILKSISSCSPASRGLEKCAQSMLQLHWLHVEIWPLFARAPCVWQSFVRPSGRFRRGVFFEPSVFHSCELSRARGVPESGEGDSAHDCTEGVDIHTLR